MTCLSIIGSSTRSTAMSAGQQAKFAGYGPANLLKAYGLTAAAARKQHGKTVAIVDAFSDPRAAVDLANYRHKFHLPPCTVATGCLRIVNQKGKSAPLPVPDDGWGTEESLDLDMVSAICPQCRILLVEATSNNASDLGIAVNRAVTMGAKYVSNSWGGPEGFGTAPLDHFFNHPGVAVNFATGDNGFGPSYPASLEYVTAVGGTALTRSKDKRGFTESAWGPPPTGEGTGSGCSISAAKAPWQHADDTEPSGCLNRTEGDVAAVADPKTGVFVTDTFDQPGHLVVGGTSVATPIITSIYALAGTPTPATYPAEYPYLHPQHLIDITRGSNGVCDPNRQYLCNALPGYDGPTGLGTPDGTSAFTDHGAH
jgi:subtilase family serine protease